MLARSQVILALVKRWLLSDAGVIKFNWPCFFQEFPEAGPIFADLQLRGGPPDAG